MNDKYILDENGDPVPEPDLIKWAKWLESSFAEQQRIVKQTKFSAAVGRIGVCEVMVSTVFLGLDHNFSAMFDEGEEWKEAGLHAPILWETMIFAKGDKMDDYQWRYGSKAEALEGHDRAVAMFVTGQELLGSG